MPRLDIVTDIVIDAGAERVWGVLTDFASYPEWNPMIRRASGELAPGRRLELHFEPAGQKGRDFKPKLLVVERGRELRWRGEPRVSGSVRQRALLRPGAARRASDAPGPRDGLPRARRTTHGEVGRQELARPFRGDEPGAQSPRRRGSGSLAVCSDCRAAT